MRIYNDETIDLISKLVARIINGVKVTDDGLSLPLVVDGMTIDDAIEMHLIDCDTCRAVYERSRPAGLGQKTSLCSTYLHLQLLRANYEGKVNNIVAHTELGDEAPKMGQLE